MAQLGSAWLRLAQLGSARASFTLARPGPAAPSVSSMGPRILRRAWGAHKADETLTPPNQRARNMQRATVDPRENRKLVRRNYFGGGRAREEFRKPAGKLFCWFCNRKIQAGKFKTRRGNYFQRGQACGEMCQRASQLGSDSVWLSLAQRVAQFGSAWFSGETFLLVL